MGSEITITDITVGGHGRCQHQNNFGKAIAASKTLLL